tara:strand:- start:2077 stop:3480 length:1404 start_codon:yes stop_codon:yes gene_type:complete
MDRAGTMLVVVLLIIGGTGSIASAQQPDIVQEHWYHSYASLTFDMQAWEDDYPEIVRLISAGATLQGRQQWVLQISDWSVQNKSDGVPKEKVYIDGGHHGNEHLGTELAFLTAEYYIEGWGDGNPEVKEVLGNTEIHILVLLNADGNDVDSRWNMNQVDLNRNYDHHWTEEETASGSGPFSEPETRNNADYMLEWVHDADLYVTMHTGTWILAYPWGFTPEMPADYELFEFIRDDIHEKIDSELPIRNANAGIYPTHGTSRDYGYGVMGYPTFTFETDDEQFLLGSVEALSSRLSTELDVMKYLIENVWFWRARLVVDSLVVQGQLIQLSVSNLGRASTENATLVYVTEDNTWFPNQGIPTDDLDSGCQLKNVSSITVCGFSVNASNSTQVKLDFGNAPLSDGEGHFELRYQKRVIDSSMWALESINGSKIEFSEGGPGFLASPSVMISLACIFLASLKSRNFKDRG